MSQENVELVRRAYELAKQQGLEAQVDVYSADAVAYGPERWPEAGPWRGPAPIRDQLRRLQEDFEEQELVLEEVTDYGEWVLVRDLWRVRGSRSGIAGEFRNSIALRIHNGEVAEVRFYANHAEALKAVGLAE
jgi:ketosteroid isomerase-like protein